MLVLDTPSNFDESSRDRYHCQIIISWADSKGIFLPGNNVGRIELMKELTANWAEPFRSLVHRIPVDAEARSIRLEDWMVERGQVHGHPRVVLVGDSAHTMTMFRGEGANNAIVDVLDLVKQVNMKKPEYGYTARVESTANIVQVFRATKLGYFACCLRRGCLFARGAQFLKL